MVKNASCNPVFCLCFLFLLFWSTFLAKAQNTKTTPVNVGVVLDFDTGPIPILSNLLCAEHHKWYESWCVLYALNISPAASSCGLPQSFLGSGSPIHSQGYEIARDYS
ncbi:unnamed protein product [Prunus brigantina]